MLILNSKCIILQTKLFLTLAQLCWLGPNKTDCKITLQSAYLLTTTRRMTPVIQMPQQLEPMGAGWQEVSNPYNTWLTWYQGRGDEKIVRR